MDHFYSLVIMIKCFFNLFLFVFSFCCVSVSSSSCSFSFCFLLFFLFLWFWYISVVIYMFSVFILISFFPFLSFFLSLFFFWFSFLSHHLNLNLDVFSCFWILFDNVKILVMKYIAGLYGTYKNHHQDLYHYHLYHVAIIITWSILPSSS